MQFMADVIHRRGHDSARCLTHTGGSPEYLERFRQRKNPEELPSMQTNTKHVLALLPSKQDRLELRAMEPHGYTFHFVDDESWRSYEPAAYTFDPIYYAQYCSSVAKEIGAAGIFSSDDLANLVAAIVARECNLPAPSIKSMFLANHKYWARKSEKRPLSCTLLSVSSQTTDCELRYPVQLKPASLYFSLLQETAHSAYDVRSWIERNKENIVAWERPFRELFRQFIDQGEYPGADVPSVVAEEFVADYASQHAVEGWTDANGDSHVWAISDNNYVGGSGSSLSSNTVPTRLSDVLAQDISRAAIEAVDALDIRKGFWNAELWMLRDGSFRLTEINGRICASMTALYRAVFGMSQYRAAIKLACGEEVSLATDVPRVSTGLGGMFAIPTRRRGYVREILQVSQVELIRAMPGVVRFELMFGPDMLINWHQTGGRCCVARAWIVGATFDEIHSKAERIRALILRSE
jgi:hypothetical protein